MFVVGLGLFARELIGGGDVKLLAALSLWAGPEHFVSFMLVTALAGGALSLFSLGYGRWGVLVEAYLATLGVVPASGRAPRLARRLDRGRRSIEHLAYGVAIAVGGIASFSN